MAARRQVSIFINGKEVANQIKAITDEKKKLVRELARMTIGSEEYNKTVEEIQKLDLVINKHKGDIKGVESAWDNVTKGAKKFFSFSNLAGVAAMAGLTIGAQEAAQAVVDIVDETKTLRREISQTTGAAGQDLDDLAIGVKALGRTFGADQRDVLLAANTLVKEFGESYSTALDEIGRGFLQGANVSGEFLQNIKEYSTQFRAAGFSAKEFIDIAIRAQQEGIFSDKGLDVIKEFGLRIREQTTATGDALDAAFGKAFTDRIFKGINDGSLSTAKALQLVAKEMQNTEVPANRLQTVIADVFGGPGEDAGLRFIQLLGDVQTETGDAAGATSEYVEAQRELLEANQELAFSENELTKQLTDTSDALTVFWTNLKTGAINVLVDVLQYFERFSATLSGVKAALGEFSIGDIFSGLTNPLQFVAELRANGKNVAKAYREAFLEGLDKIETQKEVAKTFRLQEEEAERQAQVIAEQQKKAAAAREKTRREEKRLEEKEAKELLNLKKRFIESLEKLENDNYLKSLKGAEKIIVEIEQKYEKHYESLIELEEKGYQEATQQRKRLDSLKNKEIQESLHKYLTEQFEEELRIQKELDDKKIEERVEAYFKIEKEIKEKIEKNKKDAQNLKEDERTAGGLTRKERQEIHQENLDQIEREFQDQTDLENQNYQAQIDAAQGNADQIEKIQQAHADAIQNILKKRNLAIQAENARFNKENVQAVIDSLEKAQSAVSDISDAVIAAGLEQTKFGKLVAASQIAISGAIATAKAVEKAIEIPFPANIAAVLSSVAIVIATIAKAKQALEGVSVPQRKRGGYAKVRGQDDGQTYHALLVGQPDTGLLDYPHPVLTASGTLANEATTTQGNRGREYYVSHTDLQNPKVLRHVDAIENIRTYRQRITGGFSPAPANERSVSTNEQPPTTNEQQMTAMLDLNIQLLQELLRRGVHVQLDDNTLIAMQKRMTELVKASGGRVVQ